jgi:phage terminase large subunit-like protein
MLTPDPVTQYALDVLSGREVAGPFVRLACERHMRDRTRTDIYFDLEEYERVVVRFFAGRLRLSEGQFEGIPFKPHTSQEFILGSLFAWRWKHDGTRRFKRAYLEMGKGNGKSPMAGGIGLFGLMYDNEPGAQIYSAGSTRDQSDILFQDAVKMAQAAPRIHKHITYAGNAKIWNMAALGKRQKGAFFRPLARTAGKSGSGYRPHFALCDELHEHPNRDVIDMLERGFKFRRQPLMLMITNSGTDRKSICWEEREHARRVVEGEIVDDATFSYICALDEGDDPLEDPSCWKKANPLLGVTITEAYLAGVVEQARQIPGKRNGILRLHFCVWTDSETAWLPREAWEACEDLNMRIEDFEGVPCRAGLDLSSRKDLTAKALCFDDGFVLDEEGRPQPKFALFAHGYTPEKTLRQRAREDRAPYQAWVEAGVLTATPGPVVRFPFVIEDLVKDQGKYDLQAVAYDRYLIARFEEDMNDMGANLPLVEHPQGFSRRKDTDLWMPGSIEMLEELVLQRRIRIQVNPALRSAVAGATFIQSPAALRRFAKEKATQRIDMIVAAAMAVGASCTTDDSGGISVYELLARQRLARQDDGEQSTTMIRRFGDEDDDDDDL